MYNNICFSECNIVDLLGNLTVRNGIQKTSANTEAHICGGDNLDLTDVVAVSYAHEDISFNEKVIGFVNCLREKHGYNVIIDELLRQQETAIDFNEMMAKLIPNANKVIVILTPKYKKRADDFIGGVGYEYRIILNEISSKPKKFIFVSFDAIDDDLIHRIEPAALGNREIIYLSEDDEKWDELFSKLADRSIYQFSDVATVKSEPKSKIIEFTKTKDKADLFHFAQIKLAENRQLLEQFGPDSVVAITNPMSSAVNTWKTVKLNTIIPNNLEIVHEFEKCISLLSANEVEIYKKFKIHADAFELCTKGEIGREGVPRFPSDFEKMISEGD